MLQTRPAAPAPPLYIHQEAQLLGVAGEVLFEKRREARFEPRDDLPPVAELKVFADSTSDGPAYKAPETLAR